MKYSELGISRAVSYEIRGHLSGRACQLERMGCEMHLLNIGNSRLPGDRMPETMRLSKIENLGAAEPNSLYSVHFGVTTLRDPDVIEETFERIEHLLNQYC